MPAKGSRSSEETVQRVKRGHWTKKQGEDRERTIAILREARAQQVHPSLVARGVTPEHITEAKAKGLFWCSGECKAFVPESQFGKNINRGNSRGWCRQCNANYQRRTRSRWPAERRTNISRRRVLEKYGVSPEWESAKLLEQNGVCALCLGPPDATGVGRPHRRGAHAGADRLPPSFAVDHNHGTGIARGLLCFKCNTSLARFETIPDWPQRASAYLARYQ